MRFSFLMTQWQNLTYITHIDNIHCLLNHRILLRSTLPSHNLVVFLFPLSIICDDHILKCMGTFTEASSIRNHIFKENWFFFSQKSTVHASHLVVGIWSLFLLHVIMLTVLILCRHSCMACTHEYDHTSPLMSRKDSFTTVSLTSGLYNLSDPWSLGLGKWMRYRWCPVWPCV